MAKKNAGKKWEKNKKAIHAGAAKLREHPLFRVLLQNVGTISMIPDSPHSKASWCHIHQTYQENTTNHYQIGSASLYPNFQRNLKVEEWEYVLSLALLHVSLNHLRPDRENQLWETACAIFVQKFAESLKVGSIPSDFPKPSVEELPTQDEESLYQFFLTQGLESKYAACALGGTQTTWTISGGCKKIPKAFEEYRVHSFVSGLRLSVKAAIAGAAEVQYDGELSKELMQAKSWVISSFPLLSALASNFKIIESQDVCDAMKIEIAAVNPELREVYIHPRWGFDKEELCFILAHEFLHVGLRHDVRIQGRDPYLWNIACDYVINGWLIEMDVGRMPSNGLLYDPKLAGRGAEDIYQEITQNLRWQRKLKKMQTFGGAGKPDIISNKTAKWWLQGEGVDLDSFYRRTLLEGQKWYSNAERGFLPVGLVEEIRALNQPPIPWDVELAQWMDQFFPTVEKRRSYARMSRRQSATPDIPRPYWTKPEENRQTRTFAVVLDTSGSMTRNELAKAIGAIASYAISRDVIAVRLVYCDAAPYDAGYLLSETLLHHVEVRGRGGTVLQPAIDLLKRVDDFPENGPILIITDGWIDRLSVSQPHAYLMSSGQRLPFKTKAPIFRFR